jgi:hypothetical protein
VPELGPGVHHLRWQVKYAGAWSRDVGAAFITGPFQAQEDSACNAELRLTQALLDDGAPDREGDVATALQTVVRDLVGKQFAAEGLPVLRAVRLGLHWTRDGLSTQARFDLGEGGSFEISLAIAATVVKGKPHLKLLGKTGFTYDKPFMATLRLLAKKKAPIFESFVGTVMEGFGNDPFWDAARQRISEVVALFVASMVPEMQALLAGLPAADLQLVEGVPVRLDSAYCGPLRFRERQSVTIPIHIGVRFAPVLAVAGLTGPIALGATDTAPRDHAWHPRDTAGVSLSPDLVNAILYAFWQSGAMGQWLRQGVLPALRKQTTALAYAAEDIDAELPPQIEPRTAADGTTLYEIRTAELALHVSNRARPAEVTHLNLFSEVQLALDDDERRQGVDAQVRRLVVSCRTSGGGAIVGRPCFDDLEALTLDQMAVSIDVPQFGELGDQLRAWVAQIRPQVASQALRTSAGPPHVRLTSGPVPWFDIGIALAVRAGPREVTRKYP